jgi:hypothetical protein
MLHKDGERTYWVFSHVGQLAGAVEHVLVWLLALRRIKHLGDDSWTGLINEIAE